MPKPKILLYFVYGLTDPRLEGAAAVRYIGVTLDPNTRYGTHLSCPIHDSAEKNAWVQGLREEGLEPGMEIFQNFKAPRDDKSVLPRETKWIRHYQHLGADLFNDKQKDKHIEEIESELSLEAKEVLASDTVVQQINWDELVELVTLHGGFGLRD